MCLRVPLEPLISDQTVFLDLRSSTHVCTHAFYSYSLKSVLNSKLHGAIGLVFYLHKFTRHGVHIKGTVRLKSFSRPRQCSPPPSQGFRTAHSRSPRPFQHFMLSSPALLSRHIILMQRTNLGPQTLSHQNKLGGWGWGWRWR